MRTGISITLSSANRKRFRTIVKDRNAAQKHVWRAGIVLLSADGVGTNEIMRQTGTRMLGSDGGLSASIPHVACWNMETIIRQAELRNCSWGLSEKRDVTPEWKSLGAVTMTSPTSSMVNA